MNLRWLGVVTMALALGLVVGRARAQDRPPAAPVPKVQEAGAVREEGPKAGTIVLTDPGSQEKVADEGGQIYVTRGYKGVVPGVRDDSPVPSKAGPEQPPAAPIVEWIGFQPFATYSRVFVQLEGKFAFSVVRTRPDQIEVRIPDAAVSSTNDTRQLVTRAFPTAVDEVVIAPPPADFSGVIVTIKLKKSVGYLYRSEGKYIFVDVEL